MSALLLSALPILGALTMYSLLILCSRIFTHKNYMYYLNMHLVRKGRCTSMRHSLSIPKYVYLPVVPGSLHIRVAGSGSQESLSSLQTDLNSPSGMRPGLQL